MHEYSFKSINDPVHGTIGLSELEIKLINTRAFQRLRNLKQLGLANYVFPGLDYTRFSHSIGVCHLAGKILDFFLYDLKYEGLTEKDVRHYRISGLLHDIGHYPFSHTMEEAIHQYYQDNANREGGLNPADPEIITLGTGEPEYLNHEAVSKEILRNDSEIRKILKKARIDPDYISSIFSRDFSNTLTPDDPSYLFANLISSDLDVDRIDYLLRTSYHAGLPYGKVDINYLLSQIRVDKKNGIYLTKKALRTADHFLLARYFDYAQITYHKTITAFHEVLKDVIIELIKKNKIDCSTEGIKTRINEGGWYSFDDIFMNNLLRGLISDTDFSPLIIEKTHSILEREPAKEVIKIEYIGKRTKKDWNSFLKKYDKIDKKIPRLAEQFHIDSGNWYLWKNKPIELTKIGSSSLDYSLQTADDLHTLLATLDKYEQIIRIKDDKTNKVKPIFSYDSSLMKNLNAFALYTIILYVLIPPEMKKSEKRIRKQIQKECQIAKLC